MVVEGCFGECCAHQWADNMALQGRPRSTISTRRRLPAAKRYPWVLSDGRGFRSSVRRKRGRKSEHAKHCCRCYEAWANRWDGRCSVHLRISAQRVGEGWRFARTASVVWVWVDAVGEEHRCSWLGVLTLVALVSPICRAASRRPRCRSPSAVFVPVENTDASGRRS